MSSANEHDSMTLEVAVPAPPTLSDGPDPDEYDDVTVVTNADYRREELSTFLEAGAWEEAFQRWADETEVTAEEFEIIEELALVEEFDFFWDDFASRVGYHAPGLPEDWREREIHPRLDSWGTVSSINAGLTELGQVVCDVLADEYIDWEASFEPPEDLPDF